MKNILPLLFIFLTAKAFSQDPTEIYLFDLAVKKGKVSISHPVNITNHKGYDNQPSFHPVSTLLYYTSFNDSGRADIQSYDYKTKKTKAITQTHEREYSPTVMLDGEYLSCIIQRDDNSQNLGKYPIIGGEPTVIVDNLIIGYHVWADNSHLGLFVLGDPSTLHYMRLPTKKDTILAQNIGRSLHRIPGQSAISFVHKVGEKDWLIKQVNTQTMKITTLTPAVTGKEDLCWTPDGKIMMSDGPKIFFFDQANGPGWTEVTVTSGAEVLRGVTRMAVSPDGKKLAVVVLE